jgi:hypothetical protein
LQGKLNKGQMKTIKYILFLAAVLFFSIIGCKKENISTTLEIRVVDEQGIYINGASVKLYKTQSDMENDTNQFGKTQTTDANGKVSFSNLGPDIYYWFAEKGCQNNVNGISTTPALDLNVTRVVTTTLTGTGTLTLTNRDPTSQYQVNLNGYPLLTADPGASYTYIYVPADTYYLEAIQVNGTGDKTYSGAITCGSTLTFIFP